MADVKEIVNEIIDEIIDSIEYEKEEGEVFVCEDCNRDFSDEVDDRSSFDEIGRVVCMECFYNDEDDEIIYINKVKFKNTDCLCGNNIKKGWFDKVGGIMVCEDCDIDGINPMVYLDN